MFDVERSRFEVLFLPSPSLPLFLSPHLPLPPSPSLPAPGRAPVEARAGDPGPPAAAIVTEEGGGATGVTGGLGE